LTFIDSPKMVSHAANVGDCTSLVLHPEKDVFARASVRGGITRGMVRLSVGIEANADILADLDQALES
jgi:O-acetylhomoserine/O-acetylserine sulfhydrylase-like pyridoxal-dependent enzyme